MTACRWLTLVDGVGLDLHWTGCHQPVSYIFYQVAQAAEADQAR